jgi:hypothetical protein
MNVYNNKGATFSWSWGQSLKKNEYFQVQVIGPAEEHRGIHPPTKEYSFTSDKSTYMIFTDWCNPQYYCHIHWTVAVIEWDGKDPSKIGKTITEAPKREITF